MFRWEPEGRYCHRLYTGIAPFWFSNESCYHPSSSKLICLIITDASQINCIFHLFSFCIFFFRVLINSWLSISGQLPTMTIPHSTCTGPEWSWQVDLLVLVGGCPIGDFFSFFSQDSRPAGNSWALLSPVGSCLRTMSIKFQVLNSFFFLTPINRGCFST